MPWNGHSARALLAPAIFAALGVLAASSMFGFCVDDSLIALRYARNLIDGHGYVLSAGGPKGDGVTPLPWTFVLLPIAASTSSAWRALAIAKVMTLLVHGGTCFLAARAIVKGPRPKLGSLLFFSMIGCVPLDAWAASGMETPIATLLVTIACATDLRPALRAAIAGAAATFRPELGAFAVALALADVFAEHGRSAPPLALVTRPLLAAGPFALVVVIRLAVFGHPAPLSLAAKPSDLPHGLAYAAAAMVVSGGFAIAAAPIAILRGAARDKAIAIACIVHVFAVVAVGGDSMPLARLMVPIVPALFVVAARTSAHAHVASLLVRIALVLALDVHGAMTYGKTARHTLEDRIALSKEAAPYLHDAHVIATVDVGWVAATTDATLVDLAGVTDPEIAYLRGGHTSKAVSAALLGDRKVDTLVFLELGDAPAREVEASLLQSEYVLDHFVKEASLPIGDTEYSYGIWRRTEDNPFRKDPHFLGD